VRAARRGAGVVAQGGVVACEANARRDDMLWHALAAPFKLGRTDGGPAGAAGAAGQGDGAPAAARPSAGAAFLCSRLCRLGGVCC
jgi:hypothetical protein